MLVDAYKVRSFYCKLRVMPNCKAARFFLRSAPVAHSISSIAGIYSINASTARSEVSNLTPRSFDFIKGNTKKSGLDCKLDYLAAVLSPFAAVHCHDAAAAAQGIEFSGPLRQLQQEPEESSLAHMRNKNWDHLFGDSAATGKFLRGLLSNWGPLLRLLFCF